MTLTEKQIKAEQIKLRENSIKEAREEIIFWTNRLEEKQKELNYWINKESIKCNKN